MRAAAALRAVFCHLGPNQVPLHAHTQGLGVVQHQAERIGRRMGAVPPRRATSWVCFIPSAQLRSIATHHSIPAPRLPCAEAGVPCLGRSPTAAQEGAFILPAQGCSLHSMMEAVVLG